MRLLLLLGIILMCFGCKKDTSSVSTQQQAFVTLDSLSKEKINLNILKLSPEANTEVKSFEDFQNLRNIIKSIHTSNPFFIKKYADSVDLMVGIFKENLYGSLKANTINSRITVLATESALLMELSDDKYANSQKILDANTRLLKAYNSLVIQLNELSLAIPENIEKELLKELEKTEE